MRRPHASHSVCAGSISHLFELGSFWSQFLSLRDSTHSAIIMDQATEQLHVMTVVGGDALLQFRGRIFHPEEGYEPRTLWELRLRKGIGAILNKPRWWHKWRQAGGDAEGASLIRDKWLAEIERDILNDTVEWSTRDWNHWELPEKVAARFQRYPTDGTDEERRRFIDECCATVPFHLIWCPELWENDEEELKAEQIDNTDDFQSGNERMESYGQLTWYFDLVLFKESIRAMTPETWQTVTDFELGTDAAVEKTKSFLLDVHSGAVTKATFRDYCPEGDLRPQIIDALWVHVERIMSELWDIRQCIIKTLEKVIENNKLDAENVTEFVSPGPVQETWMSDLAISEEVKQKFISEVAKLENAPDEAKDWHPHSNQQVLDLIHPSLFCCVFGQTLALESDPVDIVNEPLMNGSIPQRTQRMAFCGSRLVENKHRGSAQYQWIPSDFKVAANGDVEIMSYINNLHPVEHHAMYASIASIFKQFVPMLDRVLSCLRSPTSPPLSLELPDCERETYEIPQHPSIPEMLRLHPPGTPFSLKGRTVQVIVKVAEIHLTPDNPTYAGGTWHVEGSDAEQIVATGIYYFGCDNITESRLSFRVIVSEPYYQQDDTVGMAATFGLQRDERLVQYLGSVTATEDRCVVFPNTLQHRVDPFELMDKTKPGVRKILAFFIVNPAIRIPSTAVIPPQQLDWLKDAGGPLLTPLRRLPEVVLENVKDLLGRGMSLVEAKHHRLKLMEERRAVEEADEDYELFFSLCEH